MNDRIRTHWEGYWEAHHEYADRIAELEEHIRYAIEAILDDNDPDAAVASLKTALRGGEEE